MEIYTTNDLLTYLQKENFLKFTSKGLSSFLKKEFGVPKTRTVKLTQELKQIGAIERVSLSGNCPTTCASCYEYGCDAGVHPPINFWKLINRQS